MFRLLSSFIPYVATWTKHPEKSQNDVLSQPDMVTAVRERIERNRLTTMFNEVDRKRKLNGPTEITLGCGAYAVVVLKEKEGEKVCVKRFFKPDDPVNQNEVNISTVLLTTNSSNLVQIRDVSQTEIEMEYCDGGTLLTRFLSNKTGLDTAYKVLTDIGQALLDLQALGFIHRDVSLRNILISSGTYKLGDFGYCSNRIGFTTRKKDHLSHVSVPPEEICGMKYDVYSLGVVLSQIATRDFASIRKGKITADEKLNIVIAAMIIEDPDERWSIQQVFDFIVQKPTMDTKAGQLVETI